jgi:hypothetical protein
LFGIGLISCQFLHADIKRNKKLRKFILPAETEKDFKPKPFFKFPHQILILFVFY